MPDRRQHRGPHPFDEELFPPDAVATLSLAVEELSWLLSRGYTEVASLKLVGDRHQLRQRQRLAVKRSACSDQSRAQRLSRRVPESALSGATLDIDGFNLLTTVEAALSDGVLLLGRDGCLRDLASMHGSYRKVEETVPALNLVGGEFARLGVASACWWLDKPVSNSGRLSAVIRKIAGENGWQWTVELVNSPDNLLIESPNIVVSADSAVLDRCGRWANIGCATVARALPATRILNLGDSDVISHS